MTSRATDQLRVIEALPQIRHHEKLEDLLLLSHKTLQQQGFADGHSLSY